jgi:hypothetical protein
MIYRDSYFVVIAGFRDLPRAEDDAVFFLVRKVVLLAFVVESKVVSFAIHSTLALYILLRDIDPVAHAALHDSLEKEQLLFSRPVLLKQFEFQIVKHDVFSNRRWA